MNATAEALDRALALARRGEDDAARNAAEAALRTDPGDAGLLRFLGVLACRTGDLPRGSDYLKRAVSADPVDPGGRIMLARAMVDMGSLDEAQGVLAAHVPSGPADVEIWRMQGRIAQSQERLDDAIAAYERVVKVVPSDWEIWNNLGNACRSAGNIRDAVDALRNAVALQPETPIVRYNLGQALAQAGLMTEALEEAAQAARRAPGEAVFWLELGRMLRHLSREPEAVDALDRAIALDPGNAAAHVERGRALIGARRFVDAERAFQAALDANPGHVPAYQELGAWLERGNRLDMLAQLLDRAASENVPAEALAYVRALGLRREGRLDEALDSARQAEPDSNRARLVGRLLDRLGNRAGAFAAFDEMNRLSATSTAASDAARYRRKIEDMIATVTPAWVARWRPLDLDLSRAPPAFLVGVPRSGTTLLDTILMGHPSVHVLEEEPILERVNVRIGNLAAVADLDSGAANRLRAYYLDEVAALAPADAGLVIDKLPLNLLGAPLIHRLFPDARIVFSVRHPCDVVLSGFMQNFEHNDAMANFLDLGDAARLYDALLTFWTNARALLPLAVREVRYEALVADPETELRRLLAHLGLPWDARVLDHQRTAADRGVIITPSYDQVSEGLYSDASGRWTAYRAEMKDVLPVLLPWAERLGYPAAA